jgi:p-cumate 2,3-dioxygenase beta subunit
MGVKSASLREEVEVFLYEEAQLLDAWKLSEWLALFAPNGRYLIPSLGEPDATSQESLYLVCDDSLRLKSRVQQLLGRSAWAENPPSRTRHLVSNVLAYPQDDILRVAANFVIYRMRHELIDTYIGRYEHQLTRIDGELRFLVRKTVLDLEALRPHGKVSFIL